MWSKTKSWFGEFAHDPVGAHPGVHRAACGLPYGACDRSERDRRDPSRTGAKIRSLLHHRVGLITEIARRLYPPSDRSAQEAEASRVMLFGGHRQCRRLHFSHARYPGASALF